MGEITLGKYVMSYGRAYRGPITARNFLSVNHVVRESQADEYRAAGFENVIGIPDGEANDYGETYDWIVDNAPEQLVLVMDDDIKTFGYRLDDWRPIKDPDTVEAEFARIAQLLLDLDLGVAFCPATAAPYGYNNEFWWFGIPGAWKIVNKERCKSKMNVDLSRHVDVNYVLNELLLNRVCLDEKYFCFKCAEDTSSTSTGSVYDTADVLASVADMKARWGRYFQYNPRKDVPKIVVDR